MPGRKKFLRIFAMLLVSCLIGRGVWAVSVTTFSPQGEVGADFRQVRATFSAPMVSMGNISASAPLTFSCNLSGQGRWIDDRTWVWDISGTLPANQTCKAQIKADLKSLAGERVSGKTQFAFSTGAIKIERIWPGEYSNIAEDQAFVVKYSDSVPAQKPQLFCQTEGSPERIPMERVTGNDREVLLKHLKLEKESARVEVVRCGQRLPEGKRLQLSLVRSSDSMQKKEFFVQRAFKASLTCERENARAPCIPVRPVYLQFSAPVPRKLAEQIRISGKGEYKPAFSTDDARATTVDSVRFMPPFAPLSELQVVLPKDFKDENGRTLVNASAFPLKFKIADAPPMVKFAAAPFGIIEWNNESAVPVTLRHVENDLGAKSVRLTGGALSVKADRDIIQWLQKVNRYHHDNQVRLQEEGRTRYVQARRLSLLNGIAGVKKLTLPGAAEKDNKRSFEVIGIPVREPGLHIIEIESRLLGKSLLGNDAPMYVRTAALVTNLGVHLKTGRNNAAVWVSTLDRAQPVADAAVNVYACDGRLLWQGKTGRDGVANIPEPLIQGRNCEYNEDGLTGLLVIAHKKDEKGREDVSFVHSSWNQGIESWRFPVPTTMDAKPALIGHTVFDRTLLRAGETVSMKHFLRIRSPKGFELVQTGQLPTQIRIIHNGSGQEYRFPLVWRQNKYAETTLVLPKDARLGTYSVQLERPGVRTNSRDGARVDEDGVTLYTGAFRVEEFRLPVMVGHLTSTGKTIVGGHPLPVMLSMSYSAGGAAKGLPVQVTAMLQPRYSAPAGYPEFTFDPPYREQKEGEPKLEGKIILDKAPVKLDANGNGKVDIAAIPRVDRPYSLLTEASYRDPNGEIQTISHRFDIWPGTLQLGLAVDSWVSVGRNMNARVVVLDTQNKPVANQSVRVRAVRHNYLSSRKRLVGGFYAYESEETTEDLGQVCKAKTNERGLAYCDIALKQEGNIELVAETEDEHSNQIRTAQSVWVSAHDEVWFDMGNNDRIDVIAEKPEYNPGEKARFQVRMPFRKATAWVAVEREGIIETRVIELKGKQPSFDIEIKPEWAPNVFVSVLAVRGRIREVPWYSFFTWGWKSPFEWWDAFWNEGRDYEAPTSTVDLGKPAFKYGLTEIKVGDAAHRLNVTVKTDKATYGVRKTAQVQVQVTLPDGKPAPAGTEVAFAAVDEALLELMPNRSWDLLKAMLQQRSYGVETATAQLQVVGKRHFGRKAMEPGGGGGEAPTRELFNTLLLWEPKLILNAQGIANIKVPLNDSLTRFRFVAIADVGSGYFGSGSVQVAVTQDVQLTSGLPPVVREGDQIQTGVTVRNGSGRAMQLTVEAEAGHLPGLTPQTLQLPAGEAREVTWQVVVPEGIKTLEWHFNASEQGGEKARDRVSVTQEVQVAVPVSVQQATLRQLDGHVEIPVALPESALPGRGGVNVQLQTRLTGDMPSVRDWFLQYPYTCLEQRLSIALGLRDKARWDAIMRDISLYLDEDGLANYFPVREGSRAQGSDTLTAYILAVANEAGWAIPDGAREKMLRGLTLFVEGRLQRKFWAPRDDMAARKLAALEALSRYNQVMLRQLSVLDIQPQLWSTAMLIDWLSLLQRLPSVPEHAGKMAQAEQLLRAKMVYQGTRLGFSNERDDYWWWLMGNSDVNAARLLLVVSRLPAWKDDLPRLFNGLIARQQRGAWWTTNANAWGTLAVARFAELFESGPVSGNTAVALGRDSRTISFAGARPGPVMLSWPQGGKGMLSMQHHGSGKPWATVQTLMALPLKADQVAGFHVKKTFTPVEQKTSGVYSQGDIIRVKLEVDAQTDMTWVVVNDPIPAGATILGSGLGRDSSIAVQDQNSGGAWPSYIERRFSGYLAYYSYVPRGKFSVEYTMRVNNAGAFKMPPTRVEALYAPDVFGAAPNAVFKVVNGK